MRDRRLKALRRKFKAVWKARDKVGIVIEMPHAARATGVMVTEGLFKHVTNAFISRWLAGQDTLTIWSGVCRDFPAADQTDLEYAAKFANLRIRQSMSRGRKKKPRVLSRVQWSGGSAA